MSIYLEMLWVFRICAGGLGNFNVFEGGTMATSWLPVTGHAAIEMQRRAAPSVALRDWNGDFETVGDIGEPDILDLNFPCSAGFDCTKDRKASEAQKPASFLG